MNVVNAILQGIFLGAFYAVLACGLSLMFGVMRIINLAHGDVAVLGAYVVLVIVQSTGLSPLVAFVIALVDREEGGREAIERLGHLVVPIFTRSELLKTEASRPNIGVA